MARVVTVSPGRGGRPRKAPAGTSIDSIPGNRLLIASASSMARTPGAPLVASLMAPTNFDDLAWPHRTDGENRRHLLVMNRRPDFSERQKDSFHGVRRNIVIYPDSLKSRDKFLAFCD